MKKAARILLTIGTSIIFSGATAQELFTLEDAIRTGLENNYSIKISAGEEEIATTNLDIAKSVLFPSLELTGGASGRSTNSDLTFFDGREQNRKNRSEEHTSELQSLIRNSYSIFCLK